jgi:UDP-2-acetamido-2-deoxy-ribo-hexuluronate aminotransferase
LESWQQRRKLLASHYLENLKDVGDLSLPLNIFDPNHNAHLFGIQTDKQSSLKLFLDGQGIGSAIHYPTIIPKIPPYLDGKDYPIAEKLTKRILSLPLNPWMTEDDVLSISNEIRRFFEKV